MGSKQDALLQQREASMLVFGVWWCFVGEVRVTGWCVTGALHDYGGVFAHLFMCHVMMAHDMIHCAAAMIVSHYPICSFLSSLQSQHIFFLIT